MKMIIPIRVESLIRIRAHKSAGLLSDIERKILISFESIPSRFYLLVADLIL